MERAVEQAEQELPKQHLRRHSHQLGQLRAPGAGGPSAYCVTSEQVLSESGR